jgi:FMN-dependent NADH-azoreductase
MGGATRQANFLLPEELLAELRANVSSRQQSRFVAEALKKERPAFDGDVNDSKYVILHYFFSLPMWNFGIPYKLKRLIDVIVQPTYTFSYSPKEGYRGLVTAKPAVMVYARGGEYPAGTDGEGFDLQKRYMELILGFIGFRDRPPRRSTSCARTAICRKAICCTPRCIVSPRMRSQ